MRDFARRTFFLLSWFAILGAFYLVIQTVGPNIIETFYPVLDFKGGRQYDMEIGSKTYHCGEVISARFKFQKQRNITGTVKWQLVSSTDPRRIVLYPPRVAASPVLIIDHWACVERLPETCDYGTYYFEGTITYPLPFNGNISYGIRTQCFEVVP